MNLTKVDWLGFRTRSEIPEALNGLRGVFGPLSDTFHVKQRKNGWMGFDQAADLCLADMKIGQIAYGGESQKGWVRVDLSGRGCEWVADWEEADDSLSRLPGYQTRRVDIALDTFKREVTHDKVVAAHRAGQFATGGKPPSMVKIEPEDPREGKTVYVGKRDQGKFLRAYEKGFELISKMGKEIDICAIDGIPIGDIYRLELELKAKNADLPVDLIDKRDQYFAGAYPYLQSVLDVEPEIFSQSRERGPQRDLEAALQIMRHQYGSTLFTALAAHHGDVGAVWEKIVGVKHNENLLAAGVLLVDHE